MQRGVANLSATADGFRTQALIVQGMDPVSSGHVVNGVFAQQAHYLINKVREIGRQPPTRLAPWKGKAIVRAIERASSFYPVWLEVHTFPTRQRLDAQVRFGPIDWEIARELTVQLRKDQSITLVLSFDCNADSKQIIWRIDGLLLDRVALPRIQKAVRPKGVRPNNQGGSKE